MSWLITPQEKTAIDRFGIQNVSLLLHGNGANGSTTIVDSSPTPKTVTVVGNAQISTAQSKFGGASLVAGTSPDFTWATNRLTIPPGPDFAYGTGDFTWECFTYTTTANVNRILYSQATGGTNYFTTGIINDNRLFFTFAVSGAGTTVYGPVTSINTWTHFAVVRRSGIATVYGDGIAGTPVSCVQDFNNTTYIPNVGGYSHAPTTEPYKGYVDELRITKGIARYTSNFTPPTAPFPDF